MRRYRRAALGGTFWPLHRGHKALLDRAFAESSEVFIGLTSDRMVSERKGNEGIPPYGTRKSRLLGHLADMGWSTRAHVFRIEDEYGFAADFQSLQAIVVTEATLPNAQKINARRVSRGMTPLDVLVVPLLTAEDGGPLSSTRIRRGEVDEEGRSTRTD